MFVPTEELELVGAQARRRGRKKTLLRILDRADGYLSADAIAQQCDLPAKFIRELAVEMSERWLCKRSDANAGFEFRCPDAWVVDGYSELVIHDDWECQHLWSFDHRPATDEEQAIYGGCADCEDEDYRASEQDWSAYRAAREAGDD